MILRTLGRSQYPRIDYAGIPYYSGRSPLPSTHSSILWHASNWLEGWLRDL